MQMRGITFKLMLIQPEEQVMKVPSDYSKAKNSTFK